MAITNRNICDTRCQRFYTEMLKKENFLRMKWFLKNRDKLMKNLEEQIQQERHTELVPESKEQEAIWITSLPKWNPPNPDGSININIMKPIPLKVTEILYEKGVPSFITDKNYFHERLKEKPEDRYYFPECTSWVYGWRLQDYPPAPPSKVRRKGVMRTEFYHPKASSLNRDPEWYRYCQRSHVKSCNQ